MSAPKRLLWMVPEARGGIRTYADALWPAIQKLAQSPACRSDVSQGEGGAVSPGFECLDPIFNFPSVQEVVRARPDIVHIQHEFGLFGSKLPGLYQFPRGLAALRKALPKTRFIATAHTVLDSQYSYPWRNRGWQTPFRWLANSTLMPLMRREWLQGTWGALDGVIVHSKLQREAIRQAGCSQVVTIPHFVHALEPGRGGAEEVWAGSARGAQRSSAPTITGRARSPLTVLVFGYFSPEKGQDLVIEAWAKLRDLPVRLVLAGGVRRPEDQGYFDRCRCRIQVLGLEDRIEITGFVPDSQLNSYYASAALVVAPFRETSGSGSLAHALGRGAAILASDLPLNREIAERQSGALAFFKSENPQDLADQVRHLTAGPDCVEVMSSLRSAATRYSECNSPEEIAQHHLDFYLAIKGTV